MTAALHARTVALEYVSETNGVRTEVEQASRLLRRARAGQRLPLTVNPAPTTQSG